MRRSHVLAALVVAVVWGVNFVVIDAGLQSFPPLLFAALRFLFVAIPAVLVVRRPGVAFRWVVAVGLTLGVGQFGFLFVGMAAGMPAGLASVVVQAQAVFTVVLAVPLLGERLSPRQLLAIGLGVAGLAIIAIGRSGAVPLVALLLVLAAAASWGLGNVVTRIARPSSGLRLVVWASLVPPIPLALLSLAVDGPAADAAALRSLDLHGVAALAYLVVLATLLGHGLWTSLLRWYPATTVAPFSLLVPVVGVSAAWLLLGERPSATELVGSVVVLVAIATLALAGGPRPAPAPAAPVELDAEATVS